MDPVIVTAKFGLDHVLNNNERKVYKIMAHVFSLLGGACSGQ